MSTTAYCVGLEPESYHNFCQWNRVITMFNIHTGPSLLSYSYFNLIAIDVTRRQLALVALHCVVWKY
jgi:hypothetical protein